MADGLTPREPPTVRDIRREQVSKLWLRCPECGVVHERWPKEMQDFDGLPENNLIEDVLQCYLSHDWTPDSWEEAHEQGLVPESWAGDESGPSVDTAEDGDRP